MELEVGCVHGSSLLFIGGALNRQALVSCGPGCPFVTVSLFSYA